ncbi:MAG: RuBisCO large subunit C-terminal-like domain-containing protein [Woeseiaceae bacterium]
MIDATTFSVSGERFTVVYRIHESATVAREIADNICVEQTIEFPEVLIQDDDIRRHVIGQVQQWDDIDTSTFDATISYAVETSGYTLTQLMNVMYGNASLFPQVKVQSFELPAALSDCFAGPRFGIAGLRRLFDRPTGPLLMTALKPQGLSAEALAEQANQFALGGIDIVKDDHGLANQPFAPFRERVAHCAAAVRRANEETGGRTVYAPMLSGPSEQLMEDAHFALEQGAGAFLLAPGLIGFDAARRIAAADEFPVPMIGHPAMLGSYVVSPHNGYSHGAMFGQLMRLIGMDASIFPNYGGRFSFSKHACQEVAASCLGAFNGYATIFPTPGGGMTLDRLPELSAFYGEDVMFLIGGNLHRQGTTLAESSRAMRAKASTL